jgi:hypothetical protein
MTKTRPEEKLSLGLMVVSLLICNVGFFLYIAPYS